MPTEDRASRRRWVSHLAMHNDGLFFNPEHGDIICFRDVRDDGKPWDRFNIPQSIRHHSPTGMNWGYAGSGAADFALNVLNLYLPPSWRERVVGDGPQGRRRDVTKVWDGSSVSDDAFALHQTFKEQFIVTLPDKGGILRGSDIRDFVSTHTGITWSHNVWLVASLRERNT